MEDGEDNADKKVVHYTTKESVKGDGDKEPEYEEHAVDYEDEAQEEEHAEADEYFDVGTDEEDEQEFDNEDMEDSIENAEGGEDEKNIKRRYSAFEELEEHRQVIKERSKRKEFEVFVGGLDKDATEDDLKNVFGAVGVIMEVRLLRNPITKKNKGFAFLRFETVEQAKRAVSELKNPVVNGKRCGVVPSKDNDTLFLGNICKTWTKEHVGGLKDVLKIYGIESFEDLNLLEDSNNAGMNRGFAFLEFASHKDAIDAYRHLQRRGARFGSDRLAKISFAESFIEPDDEIMAQVKTVFVDGLPVAWDEDRVKAYVKKYGQIEKVELARNMTGAKRRDFGFVTFDSHNSAVKCAQGINEQELGEGENKVKIRARLARPVKKERGNTAARWNFRSSRGELRDSGHASWDHRQPRRLTLHPTRPQRGRDLPTGGRGSHRSVGLHDRRLDMPQDMPPPRRVRHLHSPEISYDRRQLVASEYADTRLNRGYRRHQEARPRSIPSANYESRQSSYREDYSSCELSYSDIVPPRRTIQIMDKNPYADEILYDQMPERHILPSRGNNHDYEPISGSKRPYSALDYAPSPYSDVSVRHTRVHLDYGAGASGIRYENAYAERFDKFDDGYGGIPSSVSGHDPHGFYGRHQGMSYGLGSVSGSDNGTGAGGMYPTGYRGGYIARGGYVARDFDVGSSSYSSSYPGHSLGGSRYKSSGGSGPYY
ncbi:hypothetical protein J5N97_029448 [Dioscorea zingiberensis]|uniref:RRM domain-containing protein n=1 Tax=Dioscorea zingiberensis TaxID=325984 RepID=A0A9D5C0A8_9LILI|nr:hypothetical protein J5N97_029448 [Dioscorea zingiberensis]